MADVENRRVTPTDPPLTARVIAGGLAERVARAGIVAWSIIGILLLGYIIYRYLWLPISVIFAPVAIALVVVYLLNPLVSALHRRGVRRGLGVSIIYITFLAAMTIVLMRLIPFIAREIGDFFEQVPEYVETFVDRFNSFAAARGWSARLSEQQITDWVQGNREALLSFLGGVGTVAGAALHTVVTILIGAILSIYVLLDLPKIQKTVIEAIPDRRRESVRELAEKVGRVLGGFFRGQLLVALFVGVASAIGLTLIKLPFAALVGLVAGLFNLVPLIGPFIGAIPAIILALLSGDPSKALWAALVLLVVQQLDNHVISPNVMGRTVRLHPITVMLALLAGGTIAGIFGMLIVIPGVAAAKIVVLHFWERRHQIAPAVLRETVVDEQATPGTGSTAAADSASRRNSFRWLRRRRPL